MTDVAKKKKSEYRKSLKLYFKKFNQGPPFAKKTSDLKEEIKNGAHNNESFWNDLSPWDWLRMGVSYNGRLSRFGALRLYIIPRFKREFFELKLDPWSFEFEKNPQEEKFKKFKTYVDGTWVGKTNNKFDKYNKFKEKKEKRLKNKFKELLDLGIVTVEYVQSEATRDKFKDLPGDFYELGELTSLIDRKSDYEIKNNIYQALTQQNEEKVDNMVEKFREVRKKIENVSIKDVKKTGDNQDIWVKLENLLIKMKGTTITYDTAPKTLNGLANMFAGLKNSISDIMNDGSVNWTDPLPKLVATMSYSRADDGYHNLKF